MEGGRDSAALFVNGQPIGEAAIRAQAAELRAQAEKSGTLLSFEQRLALREQAVEVIVERTLILQEARRLQLAPAREEVERLASTLVPRADGVAGCRAGTDRAAVEEEAECHLLFDRLLAHWNRGVPPPRKTEVRYYYQAHRNEFWRPEAVHAAHITKHSEGSDVGANRILLERVRERLLAGEDFAVLARTVSDCPENGGDLGFFPRGVMVEEFDAVVFEAPLHQITDLFETRFGLHLAIVHSHRAAGIAGLNEVSQAIETALHRVRQDRELGRKLGALRRSARIEAAS